MASITPDPNRRGYTLPPGCKDLVDVLNLWQDKGAVPLEGKTKFRVNGKIRSREVRVIGIDGKRLGVMPLSEALNAARLAGADLVELTRKTHPPVCLIVDYGQFYYEQAKRNKKSGN